MEKTWEHVSVRWHRSNYQLWANYFMCWNPVVIIGPRALRQLRHPLLCWVSSRGKGDKYYVYIFAWNWVFIKCFVDIEPRLKLTFIQLSGLKLLIYLHYYQITACPQLTQTIHSLLVTCRRKDSGLQKDAIDIIFLEYARHHTPRFSCIVAAWGCLLNTKSRVLLASEADTSKTVNKLVSLTTV